MLLDLCDTEAYCAKYRYLLELCVTSMGVGSFLEGSKLGWDIQGQGMRKIGVSGSPWTQRYFMHLEFTKWVFARDSRLGFYRAAWNATRSYDEISVCPSVRLSVRLSVRRVDCDKTKEKSVQIIIPRERAFTLVF